MSDYNKQSNSYSKNDRSRNNNRNNHTSGGSNNHGNHGSHGNHGNHANSSNASSGNTRSNMINRNRQQNQQPKVFKDNSGEPPISTFMLGEKELEGKLNQFHYDKGNYSIVEVEGEEKNVIYKSRNSQEAYQKWNVMIGRKKERLSRAEREQKEKEEQKEKQA